MLADKLKIGVSNRPYFEMPSKAELSALYKKQKGTCAFCGFPALKAMRAVRPDDCEVALACPFCADVLELDKAYLSTQGRTQPGYMIVMPDLSQAELNILVHQIFAQQTLNPNSFDGSTASRVYDKLSQNIHYAKLSLQKGGSEPSVIADMLMGLPDSKYAKRHSIFDDIALRYLPKFGIYDRFTEYWSQNTYKEIELLDTPKADA